MTDQQTPTPPPPFDPNAEHQAKPHLRAVRGFPVQGSTPDGQQVQMMGLADQRQISDKMVATIPAAQQVLPLMDGTRSVDDIAAAVEGMPREWLENFIAKLDDAGLIIGPNFEGMRVRMREQFDGTDILPPGSSADFADALVNAHAQKDGVEATDEMKTEQGPARLREQLNTWIDAALKEAKDPAFDTLPKAIVAPHIDYARGWHNYANVYGRMRVVDRPDRIVILGTNHFGEGTGVVVSNKGFSTPLGTCPVDSALLGKLEGDLGEPLLKNRYDHEREHSIELQLPWIQHVLGDGGETEIPILAALVHDPAVNNGESYDGEGGGLDEVVASLRKGRDELGGTTLIISSADLSHVGPAFGDREPMAAPAEQAEAAQQAEQRRNQIVKHDQDMLAYVRDHKADELISAMAWQQNPTRWCSIGNLSAMLKLVAPPEGGDKPDTKLLSYSAAVDPNGMSMVAAMAIAVM